MLAALLGSVWLAHAQPVRLEGPVTEASARGTVVLGVGAGQGVQAGDEGTISEDQVFADGSRRRVNVARIRVTAVHPDRAEAIVLQSLAAVRAGQRATFLYRAGRVLACTGAATLRVTTTPPGASVAVDGVSMDGESPMIVKGVPCGSRTVRVEKPGYRAAERTVAVNLPAVDVALALDPCAGRVEVVTEPAGAQVRIDGEPADGPSPTARELRCGEHAIVATLPGHVEAAKTVAVADRAIERVHLVLLPTEAAPALPGQEPADVHLTTFGYEGVGALQGVLTLGLLASQYAIEIDDHLVVGWRIRSEDTTVRVPPGRRRLRVLVRNIVSRSPVPLHDGYIDVAPGSRNEARINFLISLITLNGDAEAFNRLQVK